MLSRKLSAVGLGAFLLAISSMLSRLLGVVRDHVFADIFGLGLDPYYLAFRIPDLLYTLLILGALSSAFIPIYTKLYKVNSVDGDRFASQVLSALLLLLLICSGVLFFTAPIILPVLAPGLNVADLALAIELTRIMLLSPIFLGLSGILQGIENVHKKFLGTALAPLVYNLSIIGAAIYFGEDYGLYGLAMGVVFGAFLHFSVQVPGALRTHFNYQFYRPRWTNDVRDFFYLAIPRILGMCATQLTLTVDFAIASLISLGSVSVLSYALNLQSFPYGVIAVSFSVAVFSTIAEHALKENKAEMLKTLRGSFKSIWYWALPAVVGLYLLRDPLVEFILKTGSFDHIAAEQTISAFAILIWAAIPQSLIPLWSRAFYALSNTKTPLLIALVSMSLNIALDLLFVFAYKWGVPGLALAKLISAGFDALALLFFLRKDLKTSFSGLLPWRDLWVSVLATMLMALLVLGFQNYEFSSALWELLLVSLAGFLVYFALTKLMLSHKS